ncbi:MAG: tRNA (guanosine(37)-N1)-methyltransferase TrmD [Gammaproteobacteria bacterium]|nr:tRNA (guanosine(37)-N1)-methyltransferase TrmD [Gammaproteobacteria bacterium]
MKIDVVTLFPQMLTGFLEYGVIGRAVKRKDLDIQVWNPRDFTADRHRTVDDRPFGGGPGMVMMVEPLQKAVQAAKAAGPVGRKVIYLSPQGRRLDQQGLQELSQRPGVILVAGRYEGVDERFIESEVDEEWSIGDYVLSGGELAAMVLIDGMARLLPGVLGHEASAQEDSFVSGLLDCPHYTRPESYQGETVPAVLLSGDHQAIARWREKQALGRTWLRRPELINESELDERQQLLLREFIQEQNES